MADETPAVPVVPAVPVAPSIDVVGLQNEVTNLKAKLKALLEFLKLDWEL